MLTVLLVGAIAHAQWKKVPLREPTVVNPNLYRANANPVREIHAAVGKATKQHKRILLVFGASWCSDCYILDRGFHQPRIEPLLRENFLVVHVNVGQYDKNLGLARKYHINLKKGIPSIAVLSSSGRFLSSTTEFEKAHLRTEEDVIDFLNTWKPGKTHS
ncbi:MAG: thioredoxin family protein [Actinomycetota bacterium]